MASLTSQPWTLNQLMKRTPMKIQYNSDDTRIKMAKKIIDKDTKQPAVIAVIYSTHDHEGNILKSPRDHRCFIMGLEGQGKPINESRVKMSCDCEHFMFVCEVALKKKGNADIIFSNGKPARVKNPRHIPQLCKHLYRLSESLITRGM